MSSQTHRLRAGDLLEVQVGRGVAYIQYVGRHQEYGDVVFVFPGVYEHRPDNFDCLSRQSGYLTFYPARKAHREKLIKPVASHTLPISAEVPQHLRRAGARARNGQILTWIVERDGLEILQPELTEQDKLLPIAAIWNHEMLVMRIAEDWHPRREA
jgi:hypothetical protein